MNIIHGCLKLFRYPHIDTVEREGERDAFWKLFATLYNFIDTVSPDCMKYIVSFQMHAVHIGNRACETLLLQKNRLRMPYTLKITINDPRR